MSQTGRTDCVVTFICLRYGFLSSNSLRISELKSVAKLLQNCRKAVAKLSQSCRKVVTKLSQSCRKVVEKLSKSCRRVVTESSLSQSLSQSCRKVCRKICTSLCHFVGKPLGGKPLFRPPDIRVRRLMQLNLLG